MIILHFTGKGYGLMNGVSEIVYLYESEDDLPDNIKELGAPGFRFYKKYDTDTDSDVDFATLPMEQPLLRKV